MSPHVLSRIPILGKFVDERFLEHRLRSSSAAGIFAAILALVLFEYRWLHDGIWSWDIAVLVLAFLVVKLSLFTWYRLTG